MGKKKSKSKGAPALSKKDLRKLEEREAALAAELAEREKKAARKAAKKKTEKPKGKKTKAPKVEAPVVVEPADLGVMTIEAEAPIAIAPEATAADVIDVERAAGVEAVIQTEADYAPEAIVAAAERVLADKNASAGAIKSAKKALARVKVETESDDEIKARVQAKRAARAAKAPLGDMTEDERARTFMADALEGETEPQYHIRKLRERREAEAIAKTSEAIDAIKSAVEEVETERGRVFAAGESVATDAPLAAAVVVDDDFANPSDSINEKPDFERNGNGQYKVKRLSDGKIVGYTRATTYIACLEDSSRLTEWKLRILLEGVAAAEEFGERGESPTARVRELAHVRDVAIAKARKADRKGKLGIGDLARLVDRAWADFKTSMNELTDELFEIGGGRERATKGTNIHALTEIHDEKGIDAVGELLTDGKITPADMADVEAYREAMLKLGAKIVERERVVVNDDLKVAGRLDIVAMVKLPAIHDPKTGEVIRPAESRARRRVIDLKTGSTLEYGKGKLAQQIEMYAGSKGYDLETHEREDLKLDRTLGLVIHLPAGSGKATVHIVDLVAGRKGNRLAGEVRAWRNEGKRAVDLRIDVLAEIEKGDD